MIATRQLAFTFKAKVNGQEISPETIGLHSFNRFNREVEEFVAGNGRKLPMDEVRVSIESGSYKLLVALPALLASQVEPDLQRLARVESLRDVDQRRTIVVRHWQQRAKTEDGFSVEIGSSGFSLSTIRVARDTDFHTPDEDEWVEVEKYVVGTVVDIGGASKANVHLALDDGGTLIATSTEDYLRDQRQNCLYRKVQLHIAAQ